MVFRSAGRQTHRGYQSESDMDKAVSVLASAAGKQQSLRESWGSDGFLLKAFFSELDFLKM